MRTFSFRPALTLRGRTFKGLRGWAGKPLHPPLTDVPVGAYILAAAFDVISFVGGDDEAWARDFYRAASFALIGGAVVSVLAALTGFWDWKRSTEKGTQARRTVNAHACDDDHRDRPRHRRHRRAGRRVLGRAGHASSLALG